MTHCLKNVTTPVVADPIMQQQPEQLTDTDDNLPGVDSIEAERVHTSSLDDNWGFKCGLTDDFCDPCPAEKLCQEVLEQLELRPGQ